MRDITAVFDDLAGDLSRRQRLLLTFVGALCVLVLAFTLVYNWGMAALENRPQSVFQSLTTVVETMTTTGYGADSPWETPWMNVLVVTMQLTGVVIGFVTLRVLVIPLFERAPLDLDDRLTAKDAHVVIAEYERNSELLLDELEGLDVDYVLVESDVEAAKRLSDDGYQAINGDPEEPGDLERAGIRQAATLITDAGDRTASVVLTALEANEALRVVSFTPSTRRKAALAAIGVDRSVSAGTLVAEGLAETATATVALDRPSDSADVAIRELLVRHDSPLHGATVRDSPLGAHPDVTLIAGWFDGELVLSPGPDRTLTRNTVLVVAGPERALDEVGDEIAGVRGGREPGTRFVVAGFGEGGRAARAALPDAAAVTTVDESPDAGADVVGDVTEPETLQAADVAGAQAVIVTVDDDATALLTVAMARSLAPETEILARVTDADKTSAAVRAGADYVLSVQQVSARLVAAEVHGERVMDPVGQLRFVRAEGAPFAGQTLGAAREAGGGAWTVAALAREGSVVTDPEAEIREGDEVFVAGSDEGIRRFEQEMGGG